MQLVREECNYTCRSKRFPLLSSRVCLYPPLHCWGDGSRIHSKSEGQRVLAQLKAADSYWKDLDSFCGCHRTRGPAWPWESLSVFPCLQCFARKHGMTLHLSFHPLPGPTGKSFLPCSHTAGSSHWVGHLIHRENIFSDHHLPEEKLLAPKQKNVVSLKFPTRKHNSCYELRTFCLTCYMPHGKPETKEIWAKENSEILLLPFSMDFTKLSR